MRLNLRVTFKGAACKAFNDLLSSTGLPPHQVVWEAVEFLDWVRKQIANGKSFAIVDEQGNRVREFLAPEQAKDRAA